MPTTYQSFKLALTDGQLKSLQKAVAAKAELTLRLKTGQIGQGRAFTLTKTQINRLRKAASAGRGVDLTISKTQMVPNWPKVVATFSPPRYDWPAPLMMPAAKAAGKALATAGLSFGAEKLLEENLWKRVRAPRSATLPDGSTPEPSPEEKA